MKKLLALCIFAIFTLAHADDSSSEKICFNELPGEMDIPLDSPDKIKITELVISTLGEKAFIATEYIGSANLQASVYLLKNYQYCFAGDLGPAVDFRAESHNRDNKYYPLIVESKSGPHTFIRRFNYQNEMYRLSSCTIKNSRKKTHPCSAMER